MQQITEKIKDIIEFIQEKTKTKGVDNAIYLAEQKYGVEDTSEAIYIQLTNVTPTKEQCCNSITAAIEQILIDHPEFQEENTTGWDMLQTLYYIQSIYVDNNSTSIE